MNHTLALPDRSAAMRSSVLVAAVALAFTATANADICADCKWGVNKVVSYIEQNGNHDVCQAVVSEVEHYVSDLCNPGDDCSHYITNMCQSVLAKIEAMAGTELTAYNVDPTTICTEVDACDSLDSAMPSRDRRMSQSQAEAFCQNECASYPNPGQCQPSCVSYIVGGADDFAQAVTSQMQTDAQANPTIRLSNGASGNCVQDPASRQFVCSVDHPQGTQLAASAPRESKSSGVSSGATVGIAVGAVAAVLLLAGIAFKAASESNKKAPAAGSELLVQEEVYATA
eukprot:m.430523 g.430523  ORF g.430523 m.430523 type:complete len:285 (+) comp17178_c0_seq1:74-928(+)